MEFNFSRFVFVSLISLAGFCTSQNTGDDDIYARYYCEANGNVYTPYPGTDCRYFDQRAGRGPVPKNTLVKLLPCPTRTKFDINRCTCNWERLVNCEAPATPTYCQSTGNQFSLISNSSCAKFDHRIGESEVVNEGEKVAHHTCPEGTLFNTVRCTCDHVRDTECPTF